MSKIWINKELDIVNYEDINYLQEIISNPDIKFLRRSSTIMRRLLVNHEIMQSSSHRRIKLLFEVPDNKPFIQRCRGKNNIIFFQSGGVATFGATYKWAIAKDGNATVDDQQFNASINPEATIFLKIDSFLKQQVLFFSGNFVGRQDIIKYIANKSGGVHFDGKKSDKDLLIDKIRECGYLQKKDTKIEYVLQAHKIGGNKGAFEYSPDKIDPVYLEYLASCYFFVSSQSINDLINSIKKDYTLYAHNHSLQAIITRCQIASNSSA
ncbi:MAG: hypothetical protein DRP78_01950 [Candidatus Omnitrophota bacterium]|nr:MAG: hypothetical protein DRP78_01950 [Candidatus Omnitrophota bacterium]